MEIINKKDDPTISDVLEAIQAFSGDMDEKFDGINKKFDGINAQFTQIDARFTHLEEKMDNHFSGIETRLDSIEKELEDIKTSIAKWEKRDREDSDAEAQDMVKLKARMAKVEQQLQALQMRVPA